MGKKIISFFDSLSYTSIFFIFLATGIIVFGRSAFNSFVGDDLGYINHPYIQSFNFWKFFLGSSSDLGGSSFITGQFYRPTMLIALSFLYALFKQNTAFYHLFQLLLHVGNVFLVFLLFRRYASHLLSFLASMVFLVHPINTEVVLYVSNLQDILFMFFGLLGFLLISSKRNSKVHFILTPIFLFLSLISKETGILFVGVSFLYLFLFKSSGRTRWSIILFADIFLFILVRFGVAQVGLSNTLLSPIKNLPLTSRIKLFPAIISYYLDTLVYPKNLAIAQVWTTSVSIIFDYIKTSSLFIIIILAFFGLKNKNTEIKKEFVFFTIWSFSGLLIHSNIIPLEMTVADRWFYFSFIGVLGIILVVYKSFRIGKNFFIPILSFLIFLIFLLAGRSFIRVADWKNPITLYSHDSRTTQSYLLEHSLGYELMQKGELKSAKNHLIKSVDLFPTPFNTNSLGVYYYRMRDIKNAKLWFRKSIALGDYFLSYQNYARISMSQENAQETIKFLQHAISKFPKSDTLFFLLSIAYYKDGNHDDALIAAQRAYNISPSQQNAYVVHQLLNYEPIQISNK